MENNSRNLKDFTKVIIHNGLFHADDCLSVALIKQVNPNIEVIRTRDNQKLESGLEDPKTLVLDVGLGKFDHHQIDAALREDGFKHSAVGLIFAEFKDEIIPNTELQENFEEKIIKSIELFDNGQAENRTPDSITRYVQSMVPAWNQSISFDDQTKKVISDLQDAVSFITHTKDIDHTFYMLDNKSEQNEIKNHQASIEGQTIVSTIYNKQKRLNEHLLVLTKPGLPWKDILPQTEIDFIIFEAPKQHQFLLEAVPPAKDSFEQKISIPQTVLENMKAFVSQKESSVNPFVHSSGFLAALPYDENLSKEDALTCLVKEACVLIDLEYNIDKENELCKDLEENEDDFDITE